MGKAKQGFGFVAEPEPGHEKHAGKLAIPYLRHHPTKGWLCVDIRFRRLDDGKPKYSSLPGATPKLYNTPALENSSSIVGIAEGELDAVTATLCGLPTVGVPGAANWKPFWTEIFRGYQTVVVFGDGDKAGTAFVERVAGEVPNVRVVQFPAGEDFNSVYLTEGLEYMQKYWSV